MNLKKIHLTLKQKLQQRNRNKLLIKLVKEGDIRIPERSKPFSFNKKNLEKSKIFNEELKKRKDAKTLDEIVKKLVEEIPEEKEYLEESIIFNKELLGHIYFEDDFTKHLVKLLEKNEDKMKIQKYCNFIEYMWRYGNYDVVNIFDVSIAESLATYDEEWRKFAKYISNELIEYINEILIPNNILMNPNQILSKNDE